MRLLFDKCTFVYRRKFRYSKSISASTFFLMNLFLQKFQRNVKLAENVDRNRKALESACFVCDVCKSDFTEK